MSKASEKKRFFTKHLFGAGVECETKLYYYAKDYPENEQSRPFIENAVYNKRLVKALARSIYPDGIFVNQDTINEAVLQTQKLLDQGQTVVFDGIAVHDQMMARLPVMVKKDEQLTAFHVQIKAFDSRKHRLADQKGQIYSKWRSYLLDFAYQVYLLRKCYPSISVRSILVLPEKKGLAYTDHLPTILKPLTDQKSAVEVADSNQELLVKIDVSDLLTLIWDDPKFADQWLPKPTFEESLYYLRNLYLNGEKKNPVIGMKCKSCEFRVEKERVSEGVKSGFNSCWKSQMSLENPSERHVFDLIGSGTQQRMQQGIYDQREIPLNGILDTSTIAKGKGRISHQMRQALQIHKAQGRFIPEEIMRSALVKELSRWKYPLHFLDFEAGNYAVPLRSNRSPYHLVVFQFSCHTVYRDGNWEHRQWIDDFESGYPNYEVIRQLMKLPDIEEGTIIQYSDFERNALKVIRRELMNEQAEISDRQDLISWIEKIIHRRDSSHHQPPYIADLSRQVKHFYYNEEMENSLSIKDVLSSVMSHSALLKQQYSQPYSSHNFDNIIWWQSNGKGGARNPYKILMETGETPIRRGTEAMVVYGKLIASNLSPEQWLAYQQALLKYCELDTLAMVMIYQHWKEIMAQD